MKTYSPVFAATNVFVRDGNHIHNRLPLPPSLSITSPFTLAFALTNTYKHERQQPASRRVHPSTTKLHVDLTNAASHKESSHQFQRLSDGWKNTVTLGQCK